MIFDHIDQIERYCIPFKEEILTYLRDHDPGKISDGEYEIKGRELFVRVMTYVPKPPAKLRFEAHRVYADLQYVVRGTEIIQTVGSGQLKTVTEYDRSGDYQFFEAKDFISDHILNPGQFMVF